MSEEQKRVIQELNEVVKTYIGCSKIHGVGVFALQDIKKGSKLYTDNAPKPYLVPIEYFTHLKPRIQKILLERWPNIYNGSVFFYPETRIQAFLNHSEDPNYDAVHDITLKDIEKDKEITEDYKQIPTWKFAFPFLDKKL
jgi:hypothetical protein